MKVDELDYLLPENLIAQHPIYPRDYARLMVVDKKHRVFSHHKFYEIEEFINSGDILVLNNSKVIRARFHGYKEGTKGKREVFLLKFIDGFRWHALTSPNSRVKAGDLFVLKEIPEIKAKVIEKNANGENIVEFVSEGKISMNEILKIAGEVPLPPYIKGYLATEDEYQTVFSTLEGSVASPTAGLHFTEKLLKKLEEKGIVVEYITLHVGLGTFKPISEEDIEKHKIHEEDFYIANETAERINEARKNGGRLFACGTTVVRSLETAATRKGILKPMVGRTKMFIKPGYPFKIVDAIITNFHFPKTTLLALVAAFAGKELILDAYSVAVQENYRFYSFGDAMLII